MRVDVDAAFAAYLARFERRAGPKPEGAFVKVGSHLVRRLEKEEFASRLKRYFDLHDACRRMLESGSTIVEDVMIEYQEAGAWIAVDTPNLLDLFDGEVGDPDVMNQ